jgi:hypothetical protein
MNLLQLFHLSFFFNFNFKIFVYFEKKFFIILIKITNSLQGKLTFDIPVYHLSDPLSDLSVPLSSNSPPNATESSQNEPLIDVTFSDLSKFENDDKRMNDQFLQYTEENSIMQSSNTTTSPQPSLVFDLLTNTNEKNITTESYQHTEPTKETVINTESESELVQETPIHTKSDIIQEETEAEAIADTETETEADAEAKINKETKGLTSFRYADIFTTFTLPLPPAPRTRELGTYPTAGVLLKVNLLLIKLILSNHLLFNNTFF